MNETAFVELTIEGRAVWVAVHRIAYFQSLALGTEIHFDDRLSYGTITVPLVVTESAEEVLHLIRLAVLAVDE